MPIRPKTLGMLAGVSVVVLGASLCLWIVPATPRQAVRTAEKFVDLLQSHELAEAYQLTTQRQEVGNSLADFQRVVTRQWPGGSASLVQRVAMHPFQSYGNRLRRWVQRREVEMPELSVEFSVGGVPFEVRERHLGKGEWKACFFQAHAG